MELTYNHIWAWGWLCFDVAWVYYLMMSGAYRNSIISLKTWLVTFPPRSCDLAAKAASLAPGYFHWPRLAPLEAWLWSKALSVQLHLVEDLIWFLLPARLPLLSEACCYRAMNPDSFPEFFAALALVQVAHDLHSTFRVESNSNYDAYLCP